MRHGFNRAELPCRHMEVELDTTIQPGMDLSRHQKLFHGRLVLASEVGRVQPQAIRGMGP